MCHTSLFSPISPFFNSLFRNLILQQMLTIYLYIFYTYYRFIPCLLFSHAIIQHQLQSLFWICMNMINVLHVVIFHFLPELLQTWTKNTGLIPSFVVPPTLSFLIIDFLDSFLYLILKELSRILFRVKLYDDCHHRRD